MPRYSPWLDAAGAFQQGTNSLNQTLLGLAQLRFSQNLRAQELGMRAMAALSQQSVDEAQAEHYRAQTAIENAKLESAAKLGLAMRSRVPMPGFAPTRQNADALTLADIYQQASMSGALAGKGMDVLAPHNIGQNDVAVNQLGQEIGRGPAVIGPGAMYQMGKEAPLRNPAAFTLGPQEMRFDPSGKKLAYNPQVRPTAQKSSQLDPNSAARFASSLNFDVMRNEEPDIANYVLRTITNRGPAMATSPAPITGARLRVVGPNGERGTIEEGDELPEGWELE